MGAVGVSGGDGGRLYVYNVGYYVQPMVAGWVSGSLGFLSVFGENKYFRRCHFFSV